MKERILLTITLCQICAISYSQKSDIPKLKEVRIVIDNVLSRIEKYDEEGRKIFWKDWERLGNGDLYDPLVMLGSREYNGSGETKFWISAHGNVGFSIYFPEKVNDSITNEYVIDDGYEIREKIKYKWPYNIIDCIELPESLIKLDDVQKMFATGTKRLVWNRTYNEKGNLLHEVSYDKNGDTSKVEIYTYDENGKKKSMRFSFHLKERFRTYVYDEKGNLKKENRYNLRLENQAPTEEIFYYYDDSNNLIEQIKFDQGAFKSKTQNVFNIAGQILKTITWESNDNKWQFWIKERLAEERMYTYENDLKTKEIVIYYNAEKYESGYKIKTTTYQYDFY